jgi:hypothetical protein
MRQLKVLKEFRDISDYKVLHEVGSTLYLEDEVRAARLVRLGLCEDAARKAPKVEQPVTVDQPDQPDEPETTADESASTDASASSSESDEPKAAAKGRKKKAE